MQYLLTPQCTKILKRLARERTLCAFDFDGTLAPIVEHPDLAILRQRTRELLMRLTSLYPCSVLSGRSRTDVISRLEGLEFSSVIGSHGAETGMTGQRARLCSGEWKLAMDQELRSADGLWVEDKGFSLAVHYRQYPHKAEARRRILQAARNLDEVRVFGGKQVVNIVAAGAPTKGVALAAERDRLKCDWVLYVGDDENDEEAFALEGQVVPVRIGQKKHSHARYYLRTQNEIDRLLDLMITLRAAL